MYWSGVICVNMGVKSMTLKSRVTYCPDKVYDRHMIISRSQCLRMGAPWHWQSSYAFKRRWRWLDSKYTLSGCTLALLEKCISLTRNVWSLQLFKSLNLHPIQHLSQQAPTEPPSMLCTCLVKPFLSYYSIARLQKKWSSWRLWWQRAVCLDLRDEREM